MFTQELADRICAELAEGKSLREVCRGEGMPGAQTVLDWTNDPEKRVFAGQYALARARGYEVMADDIIAISDERGEDPNRSRLMMDSRKWLLSKMLPKVYGDRTENVLSGEIGVRKIERVITRNPAD